MFRSRSGVEESPKFRSLSENTIVSPPFGFVIIDKPAGMTSHDCVSRLRRVFEMKRVGHGGTLDPAVTGVLPIALGNATRLLPYLPGAKTYRGIIQLGQRTNTDDLEGELLEEQPIPKLDTVRLESCLNKFRGSIQQRPPQVSSVHFQGERAHKRVRRGEVLELPLRRVTVHELVLLNWHQSTGQLEIKVHCSSGTYIRSIARELGELLGCGGCLAKLRRTQAMGFYENQAVAMPQPTSMGSITLPDIITPLIALQHLPRLKISTEEELFHWSTGRKLSITTDRLQGFPRTKSSNEESDPLAVLVEWAGEVIGIGNWNSPSTLNPKVVFNAKG